MTTDIDDVGGNDGALAQKTALQFRFPDYPITRCPDLPIFPACSLCCTTDFDLLRLLQQFYAPFTRLVACSRLRPLFYYPRVNRIEYWSTFVICRLWWRLLCGGPAAPRTDDRLVFISGNVGTTRADKLNVSRFLSAARFRNDKRECVSARAATLCRLHSRFVTFTTCVIAASLSSFATSIVPVTVVPPLPLSIFSPASVSF